MKSVILLASLFMSLSASAENWQSFQVEGLNKAQIRQQDIQPHLQQIIDSPVFNVEHIGSSYLGRPIHRIKIGKGSTKLMLWSQMHGDESTATSALFDLMRRMEKDQGWRQSWQDKLTIYMIPMLNPDGAEQATRTNAQGIDINRDARALQTPEGRLLLAQAKELKPDFGFNLHDQNRFYSAGHHNNPATISLLAPAFNDRKSISPARHRAMQIIGVLKEVADARIPEHLGRYDDTYAPRAFGDNLAGMGISTILIESGAHRQDPNRQVAREMNLIMLSAAIDSIQSGSYAKQDLSAYTDIPFNRREAFRDVLMSDLLVKEGSQQYRIDLAIDLNLPNARQPRIKEVGDLTVYSGFFEFDANGWQFQPAKGYTLSDATTLTREDYLALLQQGYGYFASDADKLDNQSGLPMAFSNVSMSDTRPRAGHRAVFFLEHKDGRKIAVIEGLLIDLNSGKVLNSYST
ncbi:DUF2817 domain-containing protein [Bowmanella sp. Y26]|uniref:M14 family zinc carboxypeptidase n=1 Tax=Bowmanella yangjiangensis TaxID=2811230 RepID=UPI001BDC8D72|nr:M14 family zinc carboxypeptidase [Bowmanella yangjiangensis]MBT1064759.1 DUF2817 domain-containing protein [Bowmanella yangjiangensis]